jgi:hypothetical protein
MNRLLIFLTALSCAGFSAATAEEYWIAYEGNDFPENVGWDRHWGVHVPPGDPNSVPERSIEDGVFVLDTTCDIWLNDYYQIHRQIDPSPGEWFLAEWRVVVDELLVWWDTDLVIARDNPPGHVAFHFGPDSVLISTEQLEFELDNGFHAFRLESNDMDEFDLFMDGTLLHHGVFESESLLQSYVGFGNSTYGASALSRWDYVRFGTVPEPTGLALLLSAIVLTGQTRQRH